MNPALDGGITPRKRENFVKSGKVGVSCSDRLKWLCKCVVLVGYVHETSQPARRNSPRRDVKAF